MFVTPTDYTAPDSRRQFVASLCTTGFAVLRRHPLPSNLIGRMYADWQGFFRDGSKAAYRFDPVAQDGWFPPDVSEVAVGHVVRDLKEYYHIYPWGRIPPALRDDAMSYHGQATHLASALLSWVEAAMPDAVRRRLSEPLSSMILGSDMTLLRVLHYPALVNEVPANAMRAAPHADINLLTILPAASAPGLQVQDRSGEWHDVSTDPDSVVVNVGDMLQEATNGWLPSTQHRVINPDGALAGASRLSLPLFLHPRGDVVLSDRYTARSYLAERLRQLGVSRNKPDHAVVEQAGVSHGQ